MVLDTSEYRFTTLAFNEVYKYAEQNNLLVAWNDLPYGLSMKGEWENPEDTQQRFYSVDYQDFWICQDVNAMFRFMGVDEYAWPGPRVGYTYQNPYIPYQPQVWNYDVNQTGETNAATGNRVAVTAGVPMQYQQTLKNWGFLNSENDRPGIFGSATTTGLTFVMNGSNMSGLDTTIWNSISADGGALSGVQEIYNAQTNQISQLEALRGPILTTQLATALDGFTRNVVSFEDFQYRSYPSATQFIQYVNGSSSGFRQSTWVNPTDGNIIRHDFDRSSSSDPWSESTTDMGNSGSDVEGIYWTRRRGCYGKTYYAPATSGQNFRYMVMLSPAFAFYGNLSVDVYQTWGVTMDDNISCFIRRRELTMERSPYQYTNNPAVQHYVM